MLSLTQILMKEIQWEPTLCGNTLDASAISVQVSHQFFRTLRAVYKTAGKTMGVNALLAFNNNKYLIYRGWNTPFVFSTSETQGTLARSPSVTYIIGDMQILETALF